MIKAAPKKQHDSAPGALEIARRVLSIEADAVRGLIERIDERFLAAVSLIYERRGRVIVSGIGKSGHIARKIASTLSSTGTPAYFVHPAEASHGDLGMIESGDVFIAISYSGSSEELLEIVPLVKRRGAKLIAMTGHVDSALAREADVFLDAAVKQEACPHNLAPTASTTAALALGDALAVALLSARGFRRTISRAAIPVAAAPPALVHVADVMRRGNDMPCVKNGVPAMQAVLEMSRSRHGDDRGRGRSWTRARHLHRRRPAPLAGERRRLPCHRRRQPHDDRAQNHPRGGAGGRGRAADGAAQSPTSCWWSTSATG